MLTVGEKFPAFELTAVVDTDMKKAFQPVTETSYPDKWKVYFFWPKDFTFVCPTEIAAFGKMNKQFADARHATAGRQHRFGLCAPGLAQAPRGPEESALPHAVRHQARSFRTAGNPGPEGRRLPARHLHRGPREHHSLCLGERPFGGRNPEEVLRVLDALQTDELCPCNWHKGEETLKV